MLSWMERRWEIKPKILINFTFDFLSLSFFFFVFCGVWAAECSCVYSYCVRSASKPTKNISGEKECAFNGWKNYITPDLLSIRVFFSISIFILFLFFIVDFHCFLLPFLTLKIFVRHKKVVFTMLYIEFSLFFTLRAFSVWKHFSFIEIKMR